MMQREGGQGVVGKGREGGLKDRHLPTCPLCVHGAVGDPVLLREGRRGADDKLVRRGIEGRGRLHLHGVVAFAMDQHTTAAANQGCSD